MNHCKTYTHPTKTRWSASFAEKSPDKNPKRYVSGGALLTPKDPNAVPPNTMSVWAHPVYVPPNNEPARRGANDFLAVKSKGYRT